MVAWWKMVVIWQLIITAVTLSGACWRIGEPYRCRAPGRNCLTSDDVLKDVANLDYRS